MDRERIYSKCGFDCSRCPAYKDNSRTTPDRERGSAQWERYFGLHFKPDIVRCEGCQSTSPWKTGNLLPDRACPVRACAVYNVVVTCAHCANFPCAEYLKRVPGAELRRQREKAAKFTFSDAEYQRYLEPFEGQIHLKELHHALRSEELVAPKPFSAVMDIVPFPVKTGITPDKQEAMKRLHSLLAKIFSRKAANYIDQVLFERSKPYLRVLIWVMGFYGELRKEQLVLASTA